jgi:hypothetical protein
MCAKKINTKKKKIARESDIEEEIEMIDDINDAVDETADITEIEEEEISYDVDTEIVEESDFEIIFKQQHNKHKIEGKHSLGRDVIFNGRLNEKEAAPDDYESALNSDSEYISDYNYNDGFDILGSEDMGVSAELERDVYNLLLEETEIDFTQNRRKPKREDFNRYYDLLLLKINKKYNQCEIFVALSYYFTDNIFNMFKLLDKKFANSIILELKDKGYLKDLGTINFI